MIGWRWNGIFFIVNFVDDNLFVGYLNVDFGC